MMQNSSSGPLKVQTLVSLLGEPFNFNERAFRFNLTTFGGDRYICLKAPPSAQDSDPQVGIVDMFDDYSVERRTTRKADGAMKHPSEEILVLRGYNEGSSGQFIQVFDLTTKSRLAEHAFPEDICFWRFIHERTLVLVSGDDVYHWVIRGNTDEPETSPQVFMKREGKMAESDIQVINYCVDDPANPQWALLAGIYLVENRVVRGCLQLHSVEKNMSQFLQGFAGCFGTLRSDTLDGSVQFFAFVEKKPDAPLKLYVLDIYAPRGEGHPTPFKQIQEFSFPPDFQHDFMISAHFSRRQGLIFLASKNGHCMIFDALTARHLHTERVSPDGIFLAQQDTLTGGLKLINRKGVVMRVYVDEDNLIGCINDQTVASSLSERYGYRQSESKWKPLFDEQMRLGNYKVASMICALSKGGAETKPNANKPYSAITTLRNEYVLNTLKNATPSSYQSSSTALHEYFQYLLSVPGNLNSCESIELCRAACNHNRVSLLREWIYSDRLEFTEALGDVIAECDKDLATVVYTKACATRKILNVLVQQNNFKKILAMIKKQGSVDDIWGLFTEILRHLPSESRSNDPSTSDLDALIHYSIIEQRLIDPLQLFIMFAKTSKLEYITCVYTDMIQELEQSYETEIEDLETRIIEMILSYNKKHVEVIFQQRKFTKFNKEAIGKLTENYGAYKRALEFAGTNTDRRRIIRKAMESEDEDISEEWWFNYFNQNFLPDDIYDVLRDLLSLDQENMVIQYCRQNCDKLNIDTLLEVFETTEGSSGSSAQRLFYFTGSMLHSENKNLVYKFIETSMQIENWQECERVIREKSQSYDPQRVKDRLKSTIAALSTASSASVENAVRCFMYLCDIHGYIDELTRFLYSLDMMEFLEIYITRVNPKETSTVINLLMNLGISDVKILSLLNSVRGSCNIESVIDVMETRDRLPAILTWMEARLKETGWSSGMPATSVVRALNNATAKVYIDRRDSGLKNFLETCDGYDYQVIGEYCEDKDPHMAVLAYSRGHCDKELINVTNKNGLFRIQAKYLLQRQRPEVWDMVLSGPSEEEDVERMIDQLLATGLMEAKESSQILVAVEALERNGRTKNLQDLLERIILQKTIAPHLIAELSGSERLQNMLLLTAMKNDKVKAQHLIPKLNKIDPIRAAEAALEQGDMDEEALAIYEKHGMHLKAIGIILEKNNDLTAAEAYAAKVNVPAVWSRVGSWCLTNAKEHEGDSSWIKHCIINYMHVEKCSADVVQDIIKVARRENELTDLVTFLTHLKKTVGTYNVDTDLAHALARTNQLESLERLLSSSHNVNCQNLGDMLFDEAEAKSAAEGDASDLFKLAKLFYCRVPNHSKITSCLVKLGDHKTAAEVAQKADSAKTWLEVALASIEAGDWSAAESSAIRVIEHSGGEYVDKIIQGYESNGRYKDLVRILEAGCKSTNNIQLQTELGAAYAKYEPEKLYDYLNRVRSSAIGGTAALNIPKLIKICEKERQWRSVVLLYNSCYEYDQSLKTILKHPESCWDHELICSILKNVSNPDLLYQTITFYIDEHADKLNDLMEQQSMVVDYDKIIQTFKSNAVHLAADGDMSKSPLSIILPWLESEQKRSGGRERQLNELLNDIYIDYMDVDKLKASIFNYPNIDQSELARRLEQSELHSMKQLALLLYKKDKKYEHAIAIARKFNQYPEAIAIAHQSQSTEVAENLLQHFVNYPDYFNACLQICADLIRPEVAIELAWNNNMTSEVMPYVIHTVKSMNQRISNLEAKFEQQNQAATKLLSKSSLLNTPALPGMTNNTRAFASSNSFVSL